MKHVLPLLLVVVAAAPLRADPVTGPVIPDHGPVYYVPDSPLTLPPGTRWKAVFDVAGAPDEADASNYRLETVARYLNMHARAGVAPEALEVAIVLHGKATRAALSDEAFRERFDVPNPDADLLRRLAAVGVAVFVCGQSAAAYGYVPGDLADDVILSLSAMTVLVQLQSADYALIPWGAR